MSLQHEVNTLKQAFEARESQLVEDKAKLRETHIEGHRKWEEEREQVRMLSSLHWRRP